MYCLVNWQFACLWLDYNFNVTLQQFVKILKNKHVISQCFIFMNSYNNIITIINFVQDLVLHGANIS